MSSPSQPPSSGSPASGSQAQAGPNQSGLSVRGSETGIPALRLEGIAVRFGGHVILESVSLQLASRSTLVVLGESGCGKTTLLRAIAGLIPLHSGEIWLDGAPITDRPPNLRSVIYLDQEPLLFEHLTVAENAAFAMRLRKQPADEISRCVAEMLQRLDLVDHQHKREWQLSGGQKQRVAFGRAILARPSLLLLDEPFCSLDGQTRAQMQRLFAELSHELQLSSVFVTHDVKEALVVGNVFARMAGGRITAYPDRGSMINDPATGIPGEIEFWRTIR